MLTLQGIAVAPGLAHGPIHVVRARPDVVPEWAVPEAQVGFEIERLGEALKVAEEQYQRKQELVHAATGEWDAKIFGVHRMILQDPGALRTVEATIRERRINAEGAVQALIRQLHGAMSGLDGDSVRNYAEDVTEPWRVVLDILLQRDQAEYSAGEAKFILAAAELTPQVVTFLERDRILAVVAQTGGRFSHGAVLVRSFGIPCVVGLPNLMSRLAQNVEVLVDGDAGALVLRPNAEALEEFSVRCTRANARRVGLEAGAPRPVCTTDGVPLDVGVNIGSLRDLSTFPIEHCEGVGLLRTEFLYMERSEFPSEEEQYRLYRRIVEQMDGRPVVFRTLDIGGDKTLPYFQTPKEDNPSLGWRGIRVTLEWQDLLRVQLRAVLRASAAGTVRIMLPMVTSIEEVRQAREIFEGVRQQLIEQGHELAERIDLGIMIEVPSAVWVLEEMVAEVDFVAVGTNDLIQYLLAVDRDNALVSRIYDPYHPAVLRCLARIAEVAGAAGKPCGVCGELAGDEAAAVVLVGLGYNYVSVAPHFLAVIRAAVRNISFKECRELAQAALAASCSEEIRSLFAETRERLHERMMGELDSERGVRAGISPD